MGCMVVSLRRGSRVYRRTIRLSRPQQGHRSPTALRNEYKMHWLREYYRLFWPTAPSHHRNRLLSCNLGERAERGVGAEASLGAVGNQIFRVTHISPSPRLDSSHTGRVFVDTILALVLALNAMDGIWSRKGEKGRWKRPAVRVLYIYARVPRPGTVDQSQ